LAFIDVIHSETIFHLTVQILRISWVFSVPDLISASKMPSPESNLVQSLLSATPSYFYYGHLAPPGYFSGLLRAIVHLHNNEEIEMRSIR